MKLQKAIEIGELNLKEAGKQMPPDVKDALNLLIEAAEHLQVRRKNPGTSWNDLLPGETEE